MPTRTAAPTANYVRLEAALKRVKDTLLQAYRSRSWVGAAMNVSDEVAAEIRAAVDVALPLLDIRMADPGHRIPSKFNNRLRNFRKMLAAIGAAADGAQMSNVLQGMSGRTTDAWQKFIAYRDEALAIVRNLDDELMPSADMGPYTVQPYNTGKGDWTEDHWDNLRRVLREGAKLLQMYGMGRYVGGSVLVYPSRTLPASTGGPGALAMYRRTDDVMWLALGGTPQRIMQSFIHETGHRVYWKFLGSQGRAAWDAYFEGDVSTPDVDAVIRAWEAWAAGPRTSDDADEWERAKYGRHLAPWMRHLDKTGQIDLEMWTEIIARQAGVDEQYDAMTGSPKRGQVPALDKIIEKRGEIRSYMTPVTAYSTTSPGELFAEAFAHYIVDGPSRLHPRLRSELRQALPILKVGGYQGGPSAYRVAARYLG
jgi:hypothetical protein